MMRQKAGIARALEYQQKSQKKIQLAALINQKLSFPKEYFQRLEVSPSNLLLEEESLSRSHLQDAIDKELIQQLNKQLWEQNKELKSELERLKSQSVHERKCQFSVSQIDPEVVSPEETVQLLSRFASRVRKSEDVVSLLVQRPEFLELARVCLKRTIS